MKSLATAHLKLLAARGTRACALRYMMKSACDEARSLRRQTQTSSFIPTHFKLLTESRDENPRRSIAMSHTDVVTILINSHTHISKRTKRTEFIYIYK